MPKQDSQIDYEIEDTIGDGNCAYNAFALRLCKKKIFKNIEATLTKDGLSPDAEFAFFIKEAAPALGVAATWDAVKKESLRLRKHDRIALQKKLAQPLRNWSVELLNDPAENETLEQSLLDVYDKYPAKTGDDIFSRHSFVEEKFKQFKADKHSVNDVVNWWRTEGFNHFQSEMKKDGVFSGDDYLAALSKKLKLNLAVISDHFDPKRPYVLLTVNGELSMPHLTYMQARELAGRNVVTGPIEEKKFDARKPLHLMPITKESVVANLNAVPNHAAVKAYLETHKPKKDASIPGEWKSNPEGLYQLELRGVVQRERFTRDCSNPAALAEMLHRIDVIPGKDDIIAEQQRAYRDVEMLYLANPSAVHWSSVKVVSLAKKEAKKAAEKAAAEKAAPEKEVKKTVESVTSKKEAFITSALKYIEAGKAKPSQSKWMAIIKQANAEDADITMADKLAYDLANAVHLMKSGKEAVAKDVIQVTEATQIALDAELAKELHQQEYAGFRGMKR